MSRMLVEGTSGDVDFMLHNNTNVRVEFDDAIKQAGAADGPAWA